MTTDYHRPAVRVGMIGLGRAAFEDHYPIYRDHRSLFQVVATCEIIRERRSRVAADFPACRMYRRYTDLLSDPDIDLVDITTGSLSHLEIANDSLTRGYWTLLESPAVISSSDSQFLRGAAMKSRNRLIVMNRGFYAPDFMLARMAMSDRRLGLIEKVSILKEDYVRRDDWQSIKRLGGGAAYYAMPDMMLQALRLINTPPVQMWSELKRIASVGDAEDYAHVELKTRTGMSAQIEYNGGAIPGGRAKPSFEIMGEFGSFSVMPGESKGTLHVVDPSFRFPRRRCSVRTPPFGDLHENIPVKDFTLELPKDTPYGQSAFWKQVYRTVRTAAPFPITLEESLEALKFSQLMKKASTFGK